MTLHNFPDAFNDLAALAADYKGQLFRQLKEIIL